MSTRLFDIALFDLDGTIADTLDLIYEAFDAAFVPVFGKGFPPAEIRAMFGPPDHQIIRNHVRGPAADEAIERFVSHYGARHDDLVAAFPGIDELIRDCAAAGMRMAVITGKSRLTALLTLERLSLIDAFDVIYAGDDVQRQKPDPEALIAALKDLNAAGTDRAVMIGDAAADVEAGKASGISTIAVRWGSPDLDELIASEPDYLVSTVAELASLLLAR